MGTDKEELRRQKLAEIDDCLIKADYNLDKKLLDPDNFISIYEFEDLWHNLRLETDKIISDYFSEKFSSLDEAALIKKKKKNTRKEK
jgi:hypothetical protein